MLDEDHDEQLRIKTERRGARAEDDGKGDYARNNMLIQLHDMNSQLSQLLAQKDINEELMLLRQETQIQKLTICQQAEEIANLTAMEQQLQAQIA